MPQPGLDVGCRFTPRGGTVAADPRSSPQALRSARQTGHFSCLTIDGDGLFVRSHGTAFTLLQYLRHHCCYTQERQSTFEKSLYGNLV